MTHPRSAEFPGFTAAQIDAGLMTPVCEDTNPFNWQAAMDETFSFDSLAVAATEYVAAEVRAEPFWRSLLIMSGAFIAAFGFCAWAAFGQIAPADEMFSIRGGSDIANALVFTIHADGRVEFGPGFTTTDEASRRFIEALGPSLFSAMRDAACKQ